MMLIITNIYVSVGTSNWTAIATSGLNSAVYNRSVSVTVFCKRLKGCEMPTTPNCARVCVSVHVCLPICLSVCLGVLQVYVSSIRIRAGWGELSTRLSDIFEVLVENDS